MAVQPVAPTVAKVREPALVAVTTNTAVVGTGQENSESASSAAAVATATWMAVALLGTVTEIRRWVVTVEAVPPDAAPPPDCP